MGILQLYSPDEFYTNVKKTDFVPGQFCWVVVPYISPIPQILDVERSDPEEHDEVRFKLRNANRSNDFCKIDRNLPIKNLNLRSNEELLTQRAKKRPGIILSAEIDTFSDVEKLLRRKGKKHLQEDCMFVVPCYGIETPDKGSGFPSEMVSRIRCCLYRQFFYCPAYPLLPGEHIARFDRVQVVIGKDPASIEPLEFALAPEPFDIFLAMFLFCISGEEDGDLEAVRQITKKCYDELKVS